MIQEKTLNEQLREVAQKLVDLEINRKEIMSEMAELKDNFEQLVEDGADSSVDVNGGIVYISETISYKIPDGLLDETEVKSKDASKLNPELLQYFSPDLKLSAKAKKALRNEEDATLASIVDIVEKEKLVVKIG